MRQYLWLYLIAVVAVVAILPFAAAVQIPVGANVSEQSNQTYNTSLTVVGHQNAIAGNVTLINLAGLTTTQAWQGYYGNVTGVVQLADTAGFVMYNWSDLNPTGQVYSSTANVINWYNIQCFNYTATGALNSVGETPGTWNLKGMNLSQLQTTYGMNATDPDSVNNTFYLSGAGSHDTFYVANLPFPDTLCNSTRIYDNSMSGVARHFQEILQYDPLGNAVVFTSILNNNLLGFDSKTYDFEMMVLVNGHGTNTSTVPYYFYMQIG